MSRRTANRRLLAWGACVGLAVAPALAEQQVAIEPNVQAIGRVRSGELTEARASWWGFDPQDATESLQAALDSGAKRVLVDNVGAPWVVRPLRIPSNIEVAFEKGTVIEAKRGEFRGRNDSLLNLVRCDNVSLVGYGAVLRMHREDYARPPYEKAEWRHVLNIRSSRNVKVYGLTLADSGGDGIYLGTAVRGQPNEHIHIKDVVCERNYRQGISVISARGLLIENTVFRDTGGTPPQAGIDFEPNHESECLVDCVLRNCVSENNGGAGYTFYLANLTGRSEPVSIRLEGCEARGANSAPLRFTLVRSGSSSPPVKGEVAFVDCAFSGGRGPTVTISRKPAGAVRLIFRHCRFVPSDVAQPGTPLFLFSASMNELDDQGGVTFEDCEVLMNVERPLVRFTGLCGFADWVDVRGRLFVRRGSAEEVIDVTDAWLDRQRFGQVRHRLPRFRTDEYEWTPLKGFSRSEGSAWGKVFLRGDVTLVVYARAGETVTLTLQQLPVSRYALKPVPVLVCPPGEKPFVAATVPAGQPGTISFAARATGLYRVRSDVGWNRLKLISSSHAVCLSAEEAPIHLFRTTEDFFFFVPEGVGTFGLQVCGQGLERVGVKVMDPDGNVVLENASVGETIQFVASPTPKHWGRVWSVQFSKPSQDRKAGQPAPVLEDYFVVLEAVPAFLSPDPAGLLRPQKKKTATPAEP